MNDTRPVNAAAVIGGIAAALPVALFTIVLGGAIDMSMSGMNFELSAKKATPAGVLAGIAVPAAAMALIWFVSRRWSRGFALGFAIVGALAVLGAGVCNVVMTQ